MRILPRSKIHERRLAVAVRIEEWSGPCFLEGCHEITVPFLAMKFSHTLSLNSNPDWAKHYIDYAGLKKIINEVSTKYQSYLRRTTSRNDDDSSVSSNETENPSVEGEAEFLQRLMENVNMTTSFYLVKLSEIHEELATLKPVLEKSASTLDLLTMMADEHSSLLGRRNMKSLTLLQNGVRDMEDIRREICDLFTQFHNLQTFASLNCMALRKILKKYDKCMGTSLQDSQLGSLARLMPFWDGTPEIDRAIGILQQYFAHFYCNDDKDEALRRMKYMIREFVSYQRRSVWLDVIEDQRKREGAKMVTGSEQMLQQISPRVKNPIQAAGSHFCLEAKQNLGIFSTLVFVIILSSGLIFPEDQVKRHTLGLFVYVSLLWAGEVFPLFVTSMLIPFFSVTLRLIVVDGIRLDANSASKHVFASMFSHVIMLLVGGFSIAAALSKHNIARVMATSIARRCGSGNRNVLLVNMFVATILSMWISNVAAPVLCYSLVSPILKAATVETSRVAFGSRQQRLADDDRRLCRALVMGIALASNVGGMASPISSPQNLFAIEYTPIGWVEWFTVSIPLCIILNVLIWLWLVVAFEIPAGNSAAVEGAMQRTRGSSEDAFTATQYIVIIVSAGTVLLWCASVFLSDITGQMGVLGILPFVIYFGTNILNKDDLHNFMWSVVFLAMGGLVLGETVQSSGLLEVVSGTIAGIIQEQELSLWATMAVFTLLILTFTTFISHTVGAIVVLPILQSVGTHIVSSLASEDNVVDIGVMAHNPAKELVFAGALACSAAMGLPVSGFPNMTAIGQEDHVGNRFLKTSDFLRIALPASLMSWFVIASLGYTLIIVAV